MYRKQDNKAINEARKVWNKIIKFKENNKLYDIFDYHEDYINDKLHIGLKLDLNKLDKKYKSGYIFFSNGYVNKIKEDIDENTDLFQVTTHQTLDCPYIYYPYTKCISIKYFYVYKNNLYDIELDGKLSKQELYKMFEEANIKKYSFIHEFIHFLDKGVDFFDNNDHYNENTELNAYFLSFICEYEKYIMCCNFNKFLDVFKKDRYIKVIFPKLYGKNKKRLLKRLYQYYTYKNENI